MLSRTSIVSAVLLVVIGLVAHIAATPAAWGQCSWEMIYTFTGGAEGDHLGWSVSGAGDVNNDGYDDLIVGAMQTDAGGTNHGQAYVYSGQSGALLWTFTGEAEYDELGTSVSGAGDVNNDGYDDLIVGAPQNDAGGSDAGRAYVYSGQTGALLWTFTGEADYDNFGWSVSGAGDVNNDGCGDLIVGAGGNDAGGIGAGRAYVYSGETGSLLWTFTGEVQYAALGNSVSGAGDVNLDEYDDLIVGAPHWSYDPPFFAGWAYVYSGRTGDLLWTFTGEAEEDHFGYSLSGAGDVNNDGYDDLIVGAPENDTGATGAGRAYVFSGFDGGTLHIFTGEAEWERLGRSVSGAGDVNNDGYDDLILGAPHYSAAGYRAGRAHVYSGQTGALLQAFSAEAAEDQLGASVSGAGDLDKDGCADVMVAAPGNDVGGRNAGRAYVYSGATGVLLFTGEAADDYFGNSVSGAGDVDNDGYDDLIVGAPYNDAGGDRAGRAYVYSAHTCASLWTFTGEAEWNDFGYSVSGAGDVNNDGYADLIVGAPFNQAAGSQAGRAYVYSGQTGTLLHTFTGEAAGGRFGWSVSGAGDVDDDGYDDLIVTAYLYNATGRAYVYSGQTGALIWTFDGEATDDFFGASACGAGDVNNDGYADLIVGAPCNDAGGDTSGRAYVYSGQTGAVIWTFTGEAAGDRFGNSVSGAGDVNNDGYDDLIAGAFGNDAGGDYAGRAYVYSGQTGALLQTFEGEAADDFFGSAVSGAGDVNNDGYDDLIVGARYNSAGGDYAGRAYVYSGGSGTLLCTYTGEEAHDYFGYAVSGAGDVNNDGYDELIVGARGNDAGGDGAGRAYLLSCRVEDPFVRGDANGDGVIDLGDVLHLIAYLYKNGPAPNPLEAGDADCSGVIDLGDVLFIISYLYKGGPAPSC